MPYSIRTQDGIVIQNIPDDVPEDHPSLREKVHNVRVQIQTAADRKEYDPTSSMGGMDKFNAGIGKAFSDLGQGAAQLVGQGPNAAEVKEQRSLDAPLMRTGAGVAGNLAGNITALAPLSVIPGANTVAGAGAVGATMAALQPTESPVERLVNMGAGGALGAGTQAVVGPLARKAGEFAASRETQLATRESKNRVRDETLRRGQDAGYVIPPSAVNPSWLTNRMESIGGKAALGQEATARNQPVTDKLAREGAGLGADEAITKEALRKARFDAASPYRELAAINPQAAADLEALQVARQESKLQWKEHNRSGTVAAYKAAQAADAEVAALQQRLEQAATQHGSPDLVEAMKQAQVKIAKNHEVQRALNVGTGSVEASSFGRSLDRGSPMTGELETIARFQQAFPSVMREGSGTPQAGVSKSEMLAAALLGTLGAGTTDSRYGAAAGALPFLAGPARGAMLSKVMQRMVAQPNYEAGAATKALANLSDPETRQRVAMLVRALTLPSAPELVGR